MIKRVISYINPGLREAQQLLLVNNGAPCWPAAAGEGRGLVEAGPVGGGAWAAAHVFCSVFQVAAVHQRTVQQEAGGGDGKLRLLLASALRLCRSLALLTLVRPPANVHTNVRRRSG